MCHAPSQPPSRQRSASVRLVPGAAAAAPSLGRSLSTTGAPSQQQQQRHGRRLAPDGRSAVAQAHSPALPAGGGQPALRPQPAPASSFLASRTAHARRPVFPRTASSSSSTSSSSTALRSPLAFPSAGATPTPPSLVHSPLWNPASSPFTFKRAPPTTTPDVSPAERRSAAVAERRRSLTLSPPVLYTPGSALGSSASSNGGGPTSYFDQHHHGRPRPALTLALLHVPGQPSARSPPGADGFKHHLLSSPVFIAGELDVPSWEGDE